MKNLLIALIFAFTATVANYEPKTYCDGFKKGYREGFCYNDPFCISPISPICPNPIVNFTEYKHGYQRGFKAGLKAREKEDEE
jgi:hypothetical protein